MNSKENQVSNLLLIEYIFPKSALLNSASTPTHPHPLRLIPTHLHPPRTCPAHLRSLPPTQNNAPPTLTYPK